MGNPFGQFYKKSVEERKNVLKNETDFNGKFDIVFNQDGFDHMIENYITTYEIPIGILPSLVVDDKIYHVPMATEEPSVIAGASHAARIIARNGGFRIIELKREMIGQIIFKNVSDQENFKTYLESIKQTLFDIAKQAHPPIHDLGGGLKDYHIEIKPHQFVTLYASIDTKDAMGANTVNTILEAMASYITQQTNQKVLMSILSNLATHSVVKASVLLDPKTLKNSETIAQDIHQAYLYASIDPYRATTHNKGIMNGITAVALATGNDTRAIEASAHAYASISGSYQPLTKWLVIDDGMLYGEIAIPLALGTIGGSINVLPKVKLSHQILNITSAEALMKIAACVGLAQNFAALYALVTVGINQGHMKLHARSIALAAGAKENQIAETVSYMLETNQITLQNAQAYLNKINSK